MRRLSELRYEMAFGGHREQGRDRAEYRSHGRSHHRRGEEMHRCLAKSDERFGHGGRGGRGHHSGRRERRGAGRFGGARRISSDELQLLVLSLLAEKQLHGYQIIKQLETLSQGFYKPSPGMIYPLLSFLEESELASVEMEGTKKSYVMTDNGQNFLSENSENAAQLLAWLKAQGDLITAMENAYEAERKSAEHPLKIKVREIRNLLHHRTDLEGDTLVQLSQILDEAITKIKAL